LTPSPSTLAKYTFKVIEFQRKLKSHTPEMIKINLTDEEAMADPQPKVLNLLSVILPSGPTSKDQTFMRKR